MRYGNSQSFIGNPALTKFLEKLANLLAKTDIIY